MDLIIADDKSSSEEGKFTESISEAMTENFGKLGVQFNELDDVVDKFIVKNTVKDTTSPLRKPTEQIVAMYKQDLQSPKDLLNEDSHEDEDEFTDHGAPPRQAIGFMTSVPEAPVEDEPNEKFFGNYMDRVKELQKMTKDFNAELAEIDSSDDEDDILNKKGGPISEGLSALSSMQYKAIESAPGTGSQKGTAMTDKGDNSMRMVMGSVNSSLKQEGETAAIMAEIKPSTSPPINVQAFSHPKTTTFLTNMPDQDIGKNMNIKALMEDIETSLKRKDTIKDYEQEGAEILAKPN